MVQTIQQCGDLSRSEEISKFLEWTKGNSDAAKFLDDLYQSSQIIDDFGDGQVQDVLSAATKLAEAALVNMAINPFLQKHSGLLSPLLLTSLLNWYVASRWEKEPELEKKVFAFVLRESLNQVAFMVAYLCGGLQHAMETALDVMNTYHVKHGDLLKDYLEEHK